MEDKEPPAPNTDKKPKATRKTSGEEEMEGEMSFHGEVNNEEARLHVIAMDEVIGVIQAKVKKDVTMNLAEMVI